MLVLRNGANDRWILLSTERADGSWQIARAGVVGFDVVVDEFESLSWVCNGLG